MSVPTCFTSITFNYLPKARVLAASVKRTHPDWKFVVCICDRLEDHLEFNIEEEPFDEVIWGEELQIDNIYSWMFKHSVVEICTAVKGQVAWELLDRGAGKTLRRLPVPTSQIRSVRSQAIDASSLPSGPKARYFQP